MEKCDEQHWQHGQAVSRRDVHQAAGQLPLRQLIALYDLPEVSCCSVDSVANNRYGTNCQIGGHQELPHDGSLDQMASADPYTIDDFGAPLVEAARNSNTGHLEARLEWWRQRHDFALAGHCSSHGSASGGVGSMAVVADDFTARGGGSSVQCS